MPATMAMHLIVQKRKKKNQEQNKSRKTKIPNRAKSGWDDVLNDLVNTESTLQESGKSLSTETPKEK